MTNCGRFAPGLGLDVGEEGFGVFLDQPIQRGFFRVPPLVEPLGPGHFVLDISPHEPGTPSQAHNASFMSDIFTVDLWRRPLKNGCRYAFNDHST